MGGGGSQGGQEGGQEGGRVNDDRNLLEDGRVNQLVLNQAGVLSVGIRRTSQETGQSGETQLLKQAHLAVSNLPAR